MNQNQQTDIPIQPIEQPLLCSTYDEPDIHGTYNTDTDEIVKSVGRRDAGYWYKTEATGSDHLSLFQEEEHDDLPLVNALRSDVRRWREMNYTKLRSV